MMVFQKISLINELINTFNQDTLYIYTITTNDPDLAFGDTLTISAATLPTWLTLVDHGDGTATLFGTPTNVYVGEHAIVLQVTDTGELTNLQSFTIHVTERQKLCIYLPLVLRNTP